VTQPPRRRCPDPGERGRPVLNSYDIRMPIRVIGSFAVAHPGSRADGTHVGDRSARPDVVLNDGKAFGTLGAASLAASANRTPRRVALFYATDVIRRPPQWSDSSPPRASTR